MEIEIRNGFCEPDGGLLAVLILPEWRRANIERKGEIVGEMARVCEQRGVWEVEVWRRSPTARRGT